MVETINKGGNKAINNFGPTTIHGSQVVGTQDIGGARAGEVAFIQKQLDTIQERINTEAASSNAVSESALRAVEEIRRELASKSPKADILNRSLRAIDGISSVASLVGQIRALLPGVF